MRFSFFFFNDTPTTEIYTLSLHDALPISSGILHCMNSRDERLMLLDTASMYFRAFHGIRSEEHTSELQSRLHLVCRLLLEKKKKVKKYVLLLNALVIFAALRLAFIVR